jgi:hypothetical protein
MNMIKLNLANVPHMSQHDLEFAYGVGKAGLDIWPKGGAKYREVERAVEAMGLEIERRKSQKVIVTKLPADARRNLAKLERRAKGDVPLIKREAKTPKQAAGIRAGRKKSKRA